MRKQKWPELYIHLEGINDENKLVNYMFIAYPNGSVDFLSSNGMSIESFYTKRDLLSTNYFEFVGEIKPYPDDKKWKPVFGEYYYFIHSQMCIDYNTFEDDYLDKRFIDAGNCFRFKKEAMEKLKKIKEILRG